MNQQLSYAAWLAAVEVEAGRPLTSQMGTPGNHFAGEADMAESMYEAGLTVEGMVALINDDGKEMCIGGCRAPFDVDIIDPRM